MTPFPERRKLEGFLDWPKEGVRVTRGTRYGNPHKVAHVGSNAEAVRLFREDLLAGRLKVTAADMRQELQGQHLYCFCKQGEPCHADVLIEVANRWTHSHRDRASSAVYGALAGLLAASSGGSATRQSQQPDEVSV